MKYQPPINRAAAGRNWLCVFLAALATFRQNRLWANPAGMTVVSGSATARQLGSQLNITVSQAALLDWQSFNIGAGETTSFLQPSANSVVLNVIGGANPSQVFGSLKANGTVILENANGFYFGPDSMVKVGGSFIATTAPLTPDFGSGAPWQFSGLPPLASIVNYGQVEVGTGKSLFLIAENIENHGSLNAPGGSVDLVGGQSVLVSDSPDGRGLSAAVTLPQGAVDNFGRVTANGGSILMQAKVVNQDGLAQADSVQNVNGVIELVASDQLNLGANSQILARGDDSATGSAGGTVTLKSGNVFSDVSGSQIVTTGGAHGGNGGNIEVSAPDIQSLNSAMDASAQSGFTGGAFFLDPANIVLGTSGSGTVPAGGTVASGGSGNLLLDVNTAFLNKDFSQILLGATGNIYVGNGSFNSGGAFSFAASPGITWNLSKSTGKDDGQLTLEAGGSIYFGNQSLITDANNWSVTLAAGYDFANNGIGTGSGGIYLGGSSGGTGKGSISTAGGSVNLEASGGIQTGSGSVTTAGGDVTWLAGGDITFGSSAKISVANDGSVTLDAGYDFASGSVTPGGGNIYLNGGAGKNLNGSITAAAGNIDLTAGGSVEVGAGSVVTTAGGSTGGNIAVTALSGDILVGTKSSDAYNSGYDDGAGNLWGVSANLGGISTADGGNVTLDAVNGSINPSSSATVFAVSGAFGSNPGNVTLIANDQIFGTFNVANGAGVILAGVTVADPQPAIVNSSANIGSATQPLTLQLASGSWNVWAGNDIYLNEVRNPAGTFDENDSFPFNYSSAAATSLWAGNAITLLGENPTRTDANTGALPTYAPQLSLNAGAGGITIDAPIILTASSAGSLQITTRNGGSLIAENNDVSANPSGVSITMGDSASPAAPLHLDDPNQVTLDIAGSIYGLILNVPTYADITVGGSAYNFGFNGQNLSTSQTTSITVGGDIVYSDTVHGASVSLSDALSAAQLALAAPDLASSTLTDSGGSLSISGQMTTAALNDLLSPAAALDAVQTAAVLALYSDSQQANGLALAGPGNFNITARNIDLGVSGGITVDFPNAPSAALTAISPAGANISVTTSGDLDLTATTIANGGWRGGIDLNVGGVLNVGGSATSLGSASAPKGIFTTSGGDVTVNAVGDVNVDGSRIAAYDGGNISVTSQTGDVNAGSGGEGYVIFQALQLDAQTGGLTVIPSDIPLSGILATTVYGSDAALGNITVNAPEGNVNSSAGGVLQIAFNNANTTANFIDVNAGKDINATGSGIIGYDVKLAAAGNINGLVVGIQSVAVTSQQSVNVTAVSGGNVDISAAGTVSGTVIGGGDVSVSGSSIDASVRGGSVSTSGDTSGATFGAPAAGPSQPVQTADNADTVASKTDTGDDDELKKKKTITLAQKVGRVTVLFPAQK